MEDIKYAETLKNMETIIEGLKADLAEKDKKIAEITEKKDILLTNLYQERDRSAEEIEKLEGELRGEEKVLKNVENFKDEHNKKLEMIEEKTDNLEYECNKKKNEWNEKKYELMIRNTQLVVQLDEKDGAIMALRVELENLQEKFKREEEAKEQLAEEKADLETEKKKQRNEAENEKKGFLDQIENLQENCQRLEKENAALATSKKILDVEKQKEETRIDKEALDGEKKRMNEEKLELMKEKEQFEKDAKTFQLNKQEFQKDKETLKETKKEVEAEKQKIQKEREGFQKSIDKRLKEDYPGVCNANERMTEIIKSCAKDIVRATQHGHPEVRKFGLQVLKRVDEETDGGYPEVSDLVRYMEKQQARASQKRRAEKSVEGPSKKKKN